jgi:hypothetical protein
MIRSLSAYDGQKEDQPRVVSNIIEEDKNHESNENVI